MHLTRSVGIKNNKVTEFIIYRVYNKWLKEVKKAQC